MRIIFVICALLGARAEDDDLQQSVKSFKGGHGGQFQYNPGANFASLFGNRTQQGFVTVNHTQGHGLSSENLQGQNRGDIYQQGETFGTDNIQGQAHGSHHQEGHIYGRNFQEGQVYGSHNQQEQEYGTSFQQGQTYTGGYNQQGQAYGANNQHGQAYGSNNQQGQAYGSSNLQGQSYGSNNQQGQAYGSSNRQGQAYGSNNQQGQAYGNSNLQGQAYGSNNQQGQAYGSNNQQGQTYGSNGIQGQTFGSYGNQGQNYGSSSLQGQNFGSQFQQGHGPQHGINMRPNLTSPIDYNIGVCYIEVPTRNLARDPKHIPAGNGSRSDLSRIRSCCKGYIRNIHNYKICDPVCTNECVNALCTAPDTCTCFPDHVKNMAGFCVATCPIGCQNGHCNSGVCTCKEGYKLDITGKFCVPTCKENCGGIGNCTSPNTCDCKPGYHSSPEGSCKPACDACLNGDCVAPNECKCHQGYVKEQGKCVPQCNADCPAGRCVSPHNCNYPLSPPLHQPRPVLLESANQLHNPHQNQSGYPQHISGHLYPSLGNGPPCFQSCVNGECIDGKCNCKQGYILDRTDLSEARCIPNCPGGCPNGICSAPNFCICNAGYIKDHSVKGRPSCVKRSKRSIEEEPEKKKPVNVADLIRYEIPEDLSYSVNLLE